MVWVPFLLLGLPGKLEYIGPGLELVSVEAMTAGARGLRNATVLSGPNPDPSLVLSRRDRYD